ncbi:hypothetical protein D3C75_389470 [compost metagenome]
MYTLLKLLPIMSVFWNLRRIVKVAMPQVAGMYLKNHLMVAAVTVDAEITIISRVTTIIKILFRAMENRSIYRTMICHFN